jgi:hypothetical protein
MVKPVENKIKASDLESGETIIYFVSYCKGHFNCEFDNTVLYLKRPVRTEKDVRALEKKIMELNPSTSYIRIISINRCN